MNNQNQPLVNQEDKEDQQIVKQNLNIVKVVKIFHWFNIFYGLFSLTVFIMVLVSIVQNASKCSQINKILIPFIISVGLSSIFAFSSMFTLNKFKGKATQYTQIGLFLGVLFMKVFFVIYYLSQKNQTFNFCYLTQNQNTLFIISDIVDFVVIIMYYFAWSKIRNFIKIKNMADILTIGKVLTNKI